MQTSSDTSQQPFVSVIVPVYNDPRHIKSCIEALLKQTYPRDCYEILVVDNGSSDTTREVIAKYPVTLLVEDQIQSSYAARNKGLAQARGEIIAFTDSDCTPAPHWITEGVRPILEHNADLVGGNVRFTYSPRPTGAEIYDSISNMQMEQGIQKRQVAKTANLFARKRVFDIVGPFPSNLKSGGDVYWTRQATSAGHRLVYAPAAEVAHPTRRLAELVKKQYRVGKGQRAVRFLERATAKEGQKAVSAMATHERVGTRGGGKVAKFKHKAGGILNQLMPPSIALLRQSIHERHMSISFPTLLRVWLACYAARAATAAGALIASKAR